MTISERLNKACEEDKVFLNNDLTLEGLARIIGTNRTYVSIVLRDEMHTNFHEYINGKRISHAVEKLRSGKQNVKEIMYESGFNSYNSFRNAFYAVYHCTPGEYQSFALRQRVSA